MTPTRADKKSFSCSCACLLHLYTQHKRITYMCHAQLRTTMIDEAAVQLSLPSLPFSWLPPPLPFRRSTHIFFTQPRYVRSNQTIINRRTKRSHSHTHGRHLPKECCWGSWEAVHAQAENHPSPPLNGSAKAKMSSFDGCFCTAGACCAGC